jgi:RNA polymerase subunit RPABC4/transcription elongation factor Spt4
MTKAKERGSEMDFLEDLFDFGDRKHGKRGKESHEHDDDHHDDFDDDQHNLNFQQKSNVCLNCSEHVAVGAKFCPSCGKSLQKALNCIQCGNKIATNATFCPECGNKVR